MKVIMLRDMAKIGRKGEVKEVADGYAINYLIPNRFAEKATPEKIRLVEANIKGKEEAGKTQLQNLAKNIQSLSKVVVTIKANVNEKGHLYRELKKKDIVTAIKEQLGITLPEECIKTTSHIKEAGKTAIAIEGGGEKGSFELEVVGLS